ncbi:MAG: M56 family metallopeptidase [Gemmatimonadota bacterium]|nr:M56 family metallopeptidase [Gemmatimonadota bacterium]
MASTLTSSLASTVASWMLGATLFALLLGVAAWAAERSLRSMRIATRWPWVLALSAAVIWPSVASVVYRYLHSRTTQPVFADDSVPASASAIISQQLPSLPISWNERVGTALLVMWAVVSAVMLVRLLIAARTLSRARKSAEPAMLDGQPVLVTASLGPAVIGLLRPRVAVPSWFLGLDVSLRALVLRHEREHCSSRDPQLVWLASLAVAFMPWNAGVWWLSRRLRLALEIDCDTRTLKRESSHEQYGKLLLLIAQRQSGYPPATMLAESTSHLSRRISAMQMIRRFSATHVIISGVMAVGALAVACSPRIATDLTGPQAVARPSLTKTTSPGAVYFEFQVEKPVVGAVGSTGPKYPADLKARGIEGKVLAQFVVGVDGLIELSTFKVLQPEKSDSQFVAAVRTALPGIRYEAAQVGGRPVKQLVQQPFVFALGSNNASLGKLTIPGSDAARKATPTESRMVPSAGQAGVLVPNGALRRDSSTAARPNRPGSSVVTGDAVRPSTVNTEGPYFEFQVSTPVKQRPGSVGPAYPAELKAQKIEGSVLVQFVVDQEGLPEAGTFKVLRATNDAFVAAVKTALATMKFEPANLNGKVVKQLVQVPFQFSTAR